MPRSKDEDRELQIELAKLQIKHEEATSTYTIFLSVFVSLMLTTLSIYVPLGALTQNLVYVIFPTVFVIVLALPLKRVAQGMDKTRKGLEKEIQELNDRFLSKQMPIEVKENQATENKTQRRSWKLWLKKTENLALILSLVALIFTGLLVIHEYYPPASRAKFTVFLDNPTIWHSPFWENATEIDLSGSVVNEGSLAGQILRWDLFIDISESYRLLYNKYEMPTDHLLSPTERGNFTMRRTLIGENDTMLPDSAIRSCGAWFEYKDDFGLQVAQGEIDFL